MISKKLTGCFSLLFIFLLACHSIAEDKAKTTDPINQTQTSSKSIELAEKLITQVLSNKPTKAVEIKLQTLEFNDLVEDLDTDLTKKVFWLNVYNSYIQLILAEDENLYEDKSAFFSAKQILIAGVEFSFDDIEHGIIRGTKFKYGLGYVDNPFSDKEISKLQCQEVDERIHFALNCGAVSCPPVRVYTMENYEEAIESNTENFLKAETTFMEIENKVITTKLFQWYKGDFELSTVDYLKKYDVIPQWAEPEVEYSDYNWEKRLIEN